MQTVYTRPGTLIESGWAEPLRAGTESSGMFFNLSDHSVSTWKP